jgi:hypothetical protein
MSDTTTAERPQTSEQPAANLPAERPAPKPALVGGGRIAAIVPQDFESAYRLATVVVKSGMAPKSLDSIEKCTVAIMHGLEVGLTPMAALQSIAVINGTPSIWGDGMLALVRGSGLLEDLIETVEHDKDGPTIATCKVKRRGQETWVIHSFTRPEAQRAGLWRKQGPWQQYPQRMMQMRARSWALRDAFADVLRGLTSAEEAQDMVDVTARGSATTAPAAPRRSDFLNETVQPAEGDQDPETGEVESARVTDRPWKLADDIVGQEPRRKAILELLGMAKVKVDVDEIEAEHKEFIDKLGRLKAETLKAFNDRRLELPEKMEDGE